MTKKQSRANHSRVLRAAQPDADWLRTRKAILSGLKKQVAVRVGPEPREINLANLALQRELKRGWQASNKAKLLRAIKSADIIFFGDFHAFPQAQRTHLKLLKDRLAKPAKKHVTCIALEAFPISAQRFLDQYVSGEIGEEELLRLSKWKTDWGFPWENYKALVEYAKSHRCKLLALGERKRMASLEDRERSAVEAIVRYYRDNFESSPQIFVVFGELHLASRYLPKKLKDSLAIKRIKTLTVHLNSEDVYFQLAAKGLENKVDVVSYSDTKFCVLASPPWVQWQSYLLYLDSAHSDGDLEDEDWEGDLTALLVSLVRLAAQDLKVRVGPFDFAVYVAGNSQFWPQLKKRLTKSEIEVAQVLVANGRSFFIPQGSLFYLTRTTINQAAELAGQFIHANLSGRKAAVFSGSKSFEARIWIEAVGFFVSKLINHKRHSETLPDLQAKLSSLKTQDQGRASLMLALDQRYRELFFYHTGRRKARARFRTRSGPAWFEAARILGGMMGERLYLAVRSRTIKLDTVLSWMRKNPTDADFASFYEDVVLQLGPGTGALRTRKERL